eukprot:scaffold85163_cov61-Phaeocystis_antarctica.AAC.3
MAEGPLKGFASYSLTNSLSCPSSPCRNTAWCATSHTKTAPSTSTQSDEGEPEGSKGARGLSRASQAARAASGGTGTWRFEHVGGPPVLKIVCRVEEAPSVTTWWTSPELPEATSSRPRRSNVGDVRPCPPCTKVSSGAILNDGVGGRKIDGTYAKCSPRCSKIDR